jgi:hypothetical protein
LAVASAASPDARRRRIFRRLLLVSCMLAVAVFALVQDRITARATDQYVRAQRMAAAAGTTAPTIDAVMRPAVARSVRVGLLSGGLVAIAGAASAALVARWTTRG